MSPIESIVEGVIGEGVAANHMGNGWWVGSLTEFSATSGYWVKLSDSGTLTIPEATLTDPGIVYDLHLGANLISFPIAGSVDIAEAIPDESEALFEGVIGEGVAGNNMGDGWWVGSLTQWEDKKGYWAKTSDATSFSFIIPDGSLLVRSVDQDISLTNPAEYLVIQSTQQAFYFINELLIDNVDIQDADHLWILSSCNGQVTGIRQWKGNYTDIPAMGYDDTEETLTYCEYGDNVNFRLFNVDNGTETALYNEPVSWGNNELIIVNSLTDINPIPDRFNITSVYPNPFNPNTTISYGIPTDNNIKISIYDITGREVITLVNEYQNAGYYEIIWNTTVDISSGVYIIQMTSDNHREIKKVMLLK